MNALAWDDEPDGYIQHLKSYLDDMQIKVTIESDEGEFIRRLHGGSWDIVLTDLVRKQDEKVVGAEIAKYADDHGHLVFMITQHYQRIDPGKNDYGIPPQVLVKSKSTHPGWLAGEIRDELRRRGLYFHPKKVFLICGHDRGAPGTTEALRSQLAERWGLDLQMINPENLFGEIAKGLIVRMHDCAAFVTICTPDDKTNVDGREVFQPRQNVLFEMGMVMGLHRGLDRLVIIQRFGKNPEEQALLPSDLGGFLPIRFDGRIEDKFPELELRLVDLGVDLSDPPKKASRRNPQGKTKDG